MTPRICSRPLVAAVLLASAAAPVTAQTGASVAAGNLLVVQNDAANTTASVTVTAPVSVGGFGVRAGSNRGDFTVQIGASAATNFADGVMMTSVRQLTRDNTAFGDIGATTGVQRATSAVDSESSTNTGALYIPVFNTSNAVTGAGGAEFNINVSAAYFPYAAGWVGGHVRNTVNGGPFVAAASSLNGNIALAEAAPPAAGNYFLDGATLAVPTNGVHTLNLAASYANASQTGVLLVTGGKNEDNYALSRANADGTFTVIGKDNGSDGSASEQDGVAFVYVPAGTAGITAGRVGFTSTTAVTLAAGATSTAAGVPTVIHTATGTVLLTIEGVTAEDQGVLVISAEGGNGTNVDNVVTFEWSAADLGWIVQTVDLPNLGLQSSAAGIDMFSFAYVPVPEPTGLIAVAVLALPVLRRLRRS